MEDDGTEKKDATKQNPPKTSVAPVTPITAPRVAYVPPVPEHVESPIPGGAGSEVYDSLREATDFEKTDVYATIQKYLTPLSSIKLDDRSLFQIAVKQATAQEGLSVEKILATFDGLKLVLAEQKDKFESAANSYEAREVLGRAQQIADLQNAIQKKQAELQSLLDDNTRLQSEMGTAKSKAQQTRTAFSTAMSTRSMELDQEKKRYENLIKE